MSNAKRCSRSRRRHGRFRSTRARQGSSDVSDRTDALSDETQWHRRRVDEEDERRTRGQLWPRLAGGVVVVGCWCLTKQPFPAAGGEPLDLDAFAEPGPNRGDRFECLVVPGRHHDVVEQRPLGPLARREAAAVRPALGRRRAAAAARFAGKSLVTARPGERGEANGQHRGREQGDHDPVQER